MGNGCVVAVAGEVLGTDLPVGVCHPVVGRSVHLDSAQAVLEVEVEVELEAAEVFVQRWALRVEVAENETFVGLDLDLVPDPSPCA